MTQKTVPRHMQIREVLVRDLASGHFPVGGRFPGEEELQARFDVGRHTAREALKALADEGYIDRRQKSGTVVLSDKATTRYSQSLGTIENLFDFGVNTEFRLQAFGFVRLRDARTCEVLKLPMDGRFLRIAGVRVQLGQQAPLCWSEFYIPPAYAIERETLSQLSGPIYAQVIKRHGIQLDHVEQEIGATALDAGAAALLHAPDASPALMQVRRYFEGRGEMFQSTVNLYPAGRYVVQSRIERQALSPSR